MKELYELLRKTINERIEVKAKLNMISYLVEKDPNNYSVKIMMDGLLDRISELDELEKRIRVLLKK